MKQSKLKLTNETRALIKDLELQIDYLIGYTPSGLHWKQEYSMRQTMIDSALVEDYFPNEIKDKIARIQATIYDLREEIKHNQDYLTYSDLDTTSTHKIIVHDWQDGTYEI